MQAWDCHQAPFTRQDQAGAVDGRKKINGGKSHAARYGAMIPFSLSLLLSHAAMRPWHGKL